MALLAKEWERARTHLDEWNGQAIKTDTEKWRRKENGGSRARGNRIFLGYSREIEIGSWRRETERIYWQRELRETREKPLADSLARVESKSGETERGNVVDKGQIFRSLYYRSPFQRSGNICGSSSFMFARISTFLSTTLSILSLSSSTQVVQKRNFLDPVTTTRSEIGRIYNENRDKGRVNVPPTETKLPPASDFVQR